MLEYTKLPFEPKPEVDFRPAPKGEVEPAQYICSDELRLALDTALVTRRPLLLSGDPGTGKSSFARWVAANLGWRFYKFVVTSRSQPKDLLYQWDAVRKLSDAQARRLKSDHLYVDPGPLWWAMDPQSAKRRGLPHTVGWRDRVRVSSSARAQDPGQNWGSARPSEVSAEVPRNGAVLLIDEIDKAEVDFPNDLLDPLDSYQFTIPEISGEHAAVRLPRDTGRNLMPSLLVVITTNRERDLPPAFVRRCAVHELEMPNEKDLLAIARMRFGDDGKGLHEAVARILFRLRTEAGQDSNRRPATAEYLDAIRACRDLDIRPPAAEGEEPSPGWTFVEGLTLIKRAASGQR